MRPDEFFDISAAVRTDYRSTINPYVMMKEKRHQLVAWTRHAEDNGIPEVRMIPSLHHEMQEPYFRKRGIRGYEQNAEFDFCTGHYGEGIRRLRQAAIECIMGCDWDLDWTGYDNDLGSYDHFIGKNRGEFFRLYGKFMKSIDRYKRQDILIESESLKLRELYNELTRPERDLHRHLREMRAWK